MECLQVILRRYNQKFAFFCSKRRNSYFFTSISAEVKTSAHIDALLFRSGYTILGGIAAIFLLLLFLTQVESTSAYYDE